MRAQQDPLVINGSQGEGGGMLLRTALSLAALTVQPVRIHHIRGGTRKPGLTSEDLTFLQAAEYICEAKLGGVDLGSEEILYVPTRAPRPLKGVYDVGSHEKGSIPGNALMIIDSLLPILAKSGAYSTFSVKGETYNPNTLTFEAFQQATLRLHAAQGLVAFAEQNLAGFGFAAKGEVFAEVEPSALHGFDWSNRGELESVVAVVSHSGISKDIPERAVKAMTEFCERLCKTFEVEACEVPSKTNGMFVTFVARYERGIGCGTAMGGRGIRTEQVVRSAGEMLMRFVKSDATLDPFLADQALVAGALASSPTRFKTLTITPRLQTMAWVIRQFMPISITILGQPGMPGTVTINPS